MENRPSSSARMLAPIALVVFGIAALIILTTAGGSEHKARSGPTKAEQRDLRVSRERAARRQRTTSVLVRRGVYVVRTGDTLGSIAQRTGVTVERLQELNPTLDPQALTSGQRIKLR
jgi:LysM repeat protein